MTMATNQQWAADGTGEFTIGSSRRLAAILTIGHAAVAALLLFLDFALQHAPTLGLRIFRIINLTVNIITLFAV